MKTHSDSSNTSKAWYRYPIVWLIIAIPLSAVISSSTLIILANIYKDGLVVDDYYKRGKAINQILVRDQNAVLAGIRAELIFQSDNTVLLKLGSVKKINDENLELNLVHIRYPKLDQSISLSPLGQSRYTGRFKSFLASKWYVQLGNSHWRLIARKTVNPTSKIQLNVSKN